ncbi:MAG: hypothetical protein QW524_02950 [Candidatus Woesearchaeota archaeon]
MDLQKSTIKKVLHLIALFLVSILCAFTIKNFSIFQTEKILSLVYWINNLNLILKEFIIASFLLALVTLILLSFALQKFPLNMISILPGLIFLIAPGNVLLKFLGIGFSIGSIFYSFFPVPLVIKTYNNKVSALNYHISNIFSKTSSICFFLFLIYFFLFAKEDVLESIISSSFETTDFLLTDDTLRKIASETLQKQTGILIEHDKVPIESISILKNSLNVTQGVLKDSIKNTLQENKQLNFLIKIILALFVLLIFNILFIVSKIFVFICSFFIAPWIIKENVTESQQ